MVVGERRRAVGVFSNRSDAEYALTELRDAGFNMNQISVIAKDADRTGDIAGVDTQKRVGNKADEGAAAGAVTGGVLGGLTGLLVGLGTLAIPGVGPILLAGELATTLATTAAGAGIGAAAGGLVGALVGLGIPEERARVYNDRVSRGHYLVMVEGTEAEIQRAEAVLRNRGIEEFGVYNVPDATATRSDYVNPANAGVDTTRADYPSNVVDNDPKVVIVDRRDDRRDTNI
ncbi:general stress protein [Fischerella sp. PCC 9605]|uniref:general stress protein n=1 Tax=Fischerella sp. PCC 9605 TaxID=1173024 RepID=UPI00047CFFEE|nr:general stress protein [Fischerella sp. PCC 9605]